MTTQIDNNPEKTMGEVWDVAQQFGLDPFPTHFEIVPAAMVYEFGAYGLPGRFSHWTHGKAYYQMKTMYDHGLSKIYELVINANPSQAFLLETNSALENKMVMAHVLGHTDFFKNSLIFSPTNRQMPESVAVHANRIAAYEFTHGSLAVERFLDAVLSLQRHISLTPRNRPEDDERRLTPEPDPLTTPYDDIMGMGVIAAPRETPERSRKIPLEPEDDLMYFLIRHARDLEDWQRDILAIVREEMLYFLPQMRTKIINEGWASLWHYRIMEALDLAPTEYAQFSTMHAGVVSPGPRTRVNPYYLGYKVLLDIEKRWNEPTEEEQRSLGRTPGQGRAKLFEVRETESDQTLLRKYLTEDLVHDLDLYSYHLNKSTGEWTVDNGDWKHTRDQLVASLDNDGAPLIEVLDGDYHRNRELYLIHRHGGTDIDPQYAAKTLEYLYLIWNRAVHLEARFEQRNFLLSYDGHEHRSTRI